MGLGSVLFEIERSNKSLKQEQETKISQQSLMQLQDYVVRMVNYGYDELQIRKVLIKEGWTNEIIENIFMKLKK